MISIGAPGFSRCLLIDLVARRAQVPRLLAAACLAFASLSWDSIQASDAQAAPAEGRLARALAALRPPSAPVSSRPATDWLVRPPTQRAEVCRGSHPDEVVLANGLISRAFRVRPNVATIALRRLSDDASLLRAVRPEAIVSLDGREFRVGGLTGQKEQGYLLREWIDTLKSDPAAFECFDFTIEPTHAPFAWKRVRHAPNLPWPPPGVALTFHYRAPAGQFQGLTIRVHYELYDGVPIYAKWLTVHNGSDRAVTLDSFTSEILAAVEAESSVEQPVSGMWHLPPLHVQTDYSFFGVEQATGHRVAEWLPDPEYTSQVNYVLKTPCLLTVRSPLGPDQTLAPGGVFESFRAWVLVLDNGDRERRGLAIRRLYRTIAPWVAENPVMMHVRSADTPTFRNAVDQCVAAGFEMIIYTFGSGLDMENTDPAYLRRIKADVDYAHQRGIEVGAYSLLASRSVSPEHDVISPKTGATGGAIFGNSPCLCSRWGDGYFGRLSTFIEQTGLDLLEHDGSYPGDVCASTNHPGHNGLNDSQWNQWRRISDFYKWCRARGTYLNVPDYYLLCGSTKLPMGYREVNWSLPRAQQIILGRQNIFDGTWEKTPSMGWMFVPLVEYQGGGAAATLEPLAEHLDAYEAHLANNFGAGVQACYRGPRLYDTEGTRAVVRKWVDWFKRHRDILESDIIHVRRADGQDIDFLLHVNPRLETKGLAVVYNPLSEPVVRKLRLPLYYTGLRETAAVRQEEGKPKRYRLDRHYDVEVPVRVPARGVTWLTIHAG